MNSLRSIRNILPLFVIPFCFMGCFQTRDEIAKQREEQDVRNTLQQNVMEHSQGLERVQADVGRLQGRVEEMEHQRKKEMSGYASSQESNQKALTQAVEELRAKVNSIQEAQTTLFEEVKKLHEEALVSSARAVAPPPSSKKKGGKAAPSPVTYEFAVAAFQARDYGGSAANLRAFLEANPHAKKSLEARYLLGDSLFKLKNFEQAAVEFGSVHDKAAKSFYGRRSALRLAQTFKAMGKNKDAHAFAELLEQESPQSEEAKTARRLFP